MAEPAAPAAPAAPPAPAPGAAAPAPGAAPVAPAAVPAAPAAPASIIGDAKVAPAAVAIDDARKYLTDKGVKPEDMAGLKDEQIRAKYDQEKAKEAKPPEAKPGDKGTEAIELKVPDGLQIDEAQMGALKGILADANLSPSERGQKLVDMHFAALKAAVEAPTQLWSDTQVKWQAEVKADPEVGGANFEATNAAIAKVIEDIGGADAKKIRDAFTYTGAGNHPAIVKFMARAGKLLTEGSHVVGKPAGQDGAQKSDAQKLYPSHA